MSQAHVLNITNPTTFTDGTPFVGSADTQGYQISIDKAASVSIPNGYLTTFDLSTLAVWSTLKSGNHTVDLAVVTKEGVTGVFGSTSFQILGIPSAPTLAVV